MASPSAAFCQWQHQTDTASTVLVLPDGCRDVILTQSRLAESATGAALRSDGMRRADATPTPLMAERPLQVHLTPWDWGPRQVQTTPSQCMTGYRLAPGTALSDATLRAIAAHPTQTAELLTQAVADSRESIALIATLTQPDHDGAVLARRAGVSLRTLQRHFRTLALPPPEAWRLLARARRAVYWLAQDLPLAAVAAQAGYSDQAHFTRESVRWFGLPPARLRRQRDVLDVLLQPGLGGWTGEQISIR